jgi:ATP-dependent DNA helicase PIF1
MLEETVVVAAATGIAATHIGGVTIHSWAGVRLEVGGARVLLPKVLDNAAAWARWRKAKVLILDELGSFLFLRCLCILSCTL